VKTIQSLILLAALSVVSASAEEWRKGISGLVEVIVPEKRILREGEIAKTGETLRIWRGADLIIEMESSKGLVRAKGPVLLRLAPEKEGFNRAAVTGGEEKVGFVVRAVRGGGRFSEDGERWCNLTAGMILPEGTRVRAFRDSILDFYHNEARRPVRVTEHERPVTLRVKNEVAGNGGREMAAKAR
jgi:hypothetical protein